MLSLAGNWLKLIYLLLKTLREIIESIVANQSCSLAFERFTYLHVLYFVFRYLIYLNVAQDIGLAITYWDFILSRCYYK